jgi:hypothetical protein
VSSHPKSNNFIVWPTPDFPPDLKALVAAARKRQNRAALSKPAPPTPAGRVAVPYILNPITYSQYPKPLPQNTNLLRLIHIQIRPEPRLAVEPRTPAEHQCSRRRTPGCACPE